MFKRIILKIVLRLLDNSFKIDYKQIDKKALEEWAWSCFEHKGLKSYFAYEDMRILKELSFGKDRENYMLLIGRRLQLLYMFDEFRKAYENKKSAEEKKKSQAEKEDYGSR